MYEIIIGGGLISIFFLVNFTVGVMGYRERTKYNNKLYSRKIKLKHKKNIKDYYKIDNNG